MIIKCKECQYEVSERAISCPNCGISFPGITEQMGEAIDSDSRYRTWLWVPGILFFGSIATCLYDVYLGNIVGEDLARASVAKYWPYTIAGMWLYILGEVWRNIAVRVKARKLSRNIGGLTRTPRYQGPSHVDKPMDANMGSTYYEVDTCSLYIKTINGWELIDG